MEDSAVALSLGLAFYFKVPQRIYGGLCVLYGYLTYRSTEMVHGAYRVEYEVGNHSYVLFQKPKRGPTGITEVRDQDGAIITDEFIRYYGPQRDFHGFKLMPKHMNLQQLLITLDDERSLTFAENDVITI